MRHTGNDLLFAVTSDFTSFVISITYERGSDGENNTRCFEVPVVDDETIEPTEDFIGKLTTNDSATIPDDEVPLTIIDDDGKIYLTLYTIFIYSTLYNYYVGVRVRFKKEKYFVTEGDSPVELCLEKLGIATNAVIVEVSSSDGSATSKLC